jgi:hypothetical protein
MAVGGAWMLDRKSYDTLEETAQKVGESNQIQARMSSNGLDVTTRTLHVRYIVAGNPNTPKEVLAKLANDVLESIRRRVAENPRTPVTSLVAMARDPDVDVRLSVAENANTPAEILEQLANDDSVDVRYGVAENPHIPVDLLQMLTNDENPYVACRAQKTLQIVLAAV